MGKVIGFELKKLVSRIGIYILAILMAGLLVAGAFMYKPTERDTSSLSLVGDTVSEMYDNFTNDLQQNYLDELQSIAFNASTYISSSENYLHSNSKQYITQLYNAFDEYCLLYIDPTLSNDEKGTILNSINQTFTELKTELDNGLNPTKDATGFYILTTNDNYTKLYSLINKTTINFTSPASHNFAGEKYVNELRPALNKSLNELIYPNLSETAQKYIESGAYYTLISSRMEEIAYKMEQEYNKVLVDSSLNDSKSIKNELNTLFNRYANCVKIFTTSYNSSMCVQALNGVTNHTTRSNLVGYGNISLYQQEETALQYQYYIEKHVGINDFANGLSMTHTSNGKTNAYDFTFFVMSLFAVLVIVFAIYLSAHTISGEINSNTMRFTALRPVKRSTLFFGKYIAIMIMAFILLLFGTITSLTVGGILYGFNSANILMIINSTWVFNIHPLAVIAIFVLSLWLTTALYSALAIMLSAIFKSDLLAMIVSVVIYVVNLILPLFFGITSWLKFYPLANINLFAYFGSTSETTDSILSKLFNNVVYQGMNIWISLIYVLGITTILLLIGRHIFKKREL